MSTEKTPAPREHELKCHPGPFQAVKRGTKTHEIRVDDRGFEVGHVLHLREWVPQSGKYYTGDSVRVVVTHKTPGGEWGLPSHLCVMSIAPAAAVEETREPADPLSDTEKPSAPVCSTCNDTHRMTIGDPERGEDHIVMCTHCPAPCQSCRAGGNGPFCETTPCACPCHRGHWQYAKPAPSAPQGTGEGTAPAGCLACGWEGTEADLARDADGHPADLCPECKRTGTMVDPRYSVSWASQRGCPYPEMHADERLLSAPAGGEGTAPSAEERTTVRRLAAAATPGPYYYGRFSADTPEGQIEQFAEAVRAHPPGPIYGVSIPVPGGTPIEDDALYVAITGNGPTSVGNARWLTYTTPDNVLRLLDALEAAETAVRGNRAYGESMERCVGYAEAERDAAIARANALCRDLDERAKRLEWYFEEHRKDQSRATAAEARAGALEAVLRAVIELHQPNEQVVSKSHTAHFDDEAFVCLVCQRWAISAADIEHTDGCWYRQAERVLATPGPTTRERAGTEDETGETEKGTSE